MRFTIEREPLARVASDARRGQAPETSLGVGVNDLAGAMAGKQRQHDRDEASDDMCVGIALEVDDGSAPAPISW